MAAHHSSIRVKYSSGTEEVALRSFFQIFPEDIKLDQIAEFVGVAKFYWAQISRNLHGYAPRYLFDDAERLLENLGIRVTYDCAEDLVELIAGIAADLETPVTYENLERRVGKIGKGFQEWGILLSPELQVSLGLATLIVGGGEQGKGHWKDRRELTAEELLARRGFNIETQQQFREYGVQGLIDELNQSRVAEEILPVT